MSGASTEPPADWHLEFTRSGGFAGESKMIVVNGDGTFVATDERRQLQSEGKLSLADSQGIAHMLDGLYPLPAVRPGGECRDCFSYTIRLDFGGKPSEVTFDESVLPDTGLGELVATLNSILDRELTGG